jgi:hypothetical protein
VNKGVVEPFGNVWILGKVGSHKLAGVVLLYVGFKVSDEFGCHVSILEGRMGVVCGYLSSI